MLLSRRSWDRRVVQEPAQHEYGLLAHAQRTPTSAGTDRAPVVVEQTGQVGDRFAGYVEEGRIRGHMRLPAVSTVFSEISRTGELRVVVGGSRSGVAPWP